MLTILSVKVVVCGAFGAGDIIVGLNPVSSHWWDATLNGETGIVPLTHVVELHSSHDGHLCNLWSSGASMEEDPKSSVNSGVAGVKVIADSDLTAQLDDELTFCRGDVIYILEDLGEGFAIGECNGAVGQFPLCFCTPADPQAAGSFPSPEAPPSINTVSQVGCPSWKKPHARVSSYTLANTRSQDCSVIPYCSTLYEFQGRASNELSFGVGQIVHLISHLDDDWCFGELDGKSGAFPTSYVDIIVDCDVTNGDQLQPKVEAEPVETAASVPVETQTSLSSNQPAHHGGNTTELYGRLICDFVAVNVNEVDAAEGETVTVLQRIDPDWLEVRHDNGRIGLCPMSFVELFGAEPEPTAVKPDIRTSSVVKPKLPVKPKSLSATKSRSVSSSNIDQSCKSPVYTEPPVLNTQPVRVQPDNNNTFMPSTSSILASPTTEAPKSTHRATTSTSTTATNSVSATQRHPPSPGLSLDELIQAQIMSAKSPSSTPAVREIKPAAYPAGITLNGVADVAGQATWYKFTETETDQVGTALVVTRKPPPPPRPAPSRPPPALASLSTLRNGGGQDVVDGLPTPRKPPTNLIDFSPDHNASK